MNRIVALTALLLATSNASATFLDSYPATLGEADLTITSINLTSPQLTVPGEFTISNDPPVADVVVTVSETSLSFDYLQSNQFLSGTFNDHSLTEDSPGAPPFTMALVDPSTTVPGLDQSRVTFDVTHVYVDVAFLSNAAGESFTVDFIAVRFGKGGCGPCRRY